MRVERGSKTGEKIGTVALSATARGMSWMLVANKWQRWKCVPIADATPCQSLSRLAVFYSILAFNRGPVRRFYKTVQSTYPPICITGAQLMLPKPNYTPALLLQGAIDMLITHSVSLYFFVPI